MRDTGIPKLTSWRWAPCAALVLGSLSFVAFARLAIPERIGGAAEGAATLQLGGHLVNPTSPPSPADWSGQSAQLKTGASTHVDSALPDRPTRVATHGAEAFPKRGFTPPLERPEPPPPPPVLAPPPEPPPQTAPEATPVQPPPLDAPPLPAPQQAQQQATGSSPIQGAATN